MSTDTPLLSSDHPKEAADASTANAGKKLSSEANSKGGSNQPKPDDAANQALIDQHILQPLTITDGDKEPNSASEPKAIPVDSSNNPPAPSAEGPTMDGLDTAGRDVGLVTKLTAEGTGDAIKQDASAIWDDVTHPITTYDDLANSPSALAEQRIRPDMLTIFDSKDTAAERDSALDDLGSTMGQQLIDSQPPIMLAVQAGKMVDQDYHRSVAAVDDLKTVLNPNASGNTPDKVQQAEADYKKNAGPVVIDAGVTALSFTGVGAIAKGGAVAADTADALDATAASVDETAGATRVIADGAKPADIIPPEGAAGPSDAPVTAKAGPSDAPVTAKAGAGDAPATSKPAPADPPATSKPAAQDAPPASKATAAKVSDAPANDNAASNGTKEVSAAKGDSGDAPAKPSSQSPDPEAQAKTVKRLATGKIQNIRTGNDNGLLKDVTRADATDESGTTPVVLRPQDPARPDDLLGRISQAQLDTKVDAITGQDSGAPLSALRNDVGTNGQLVAVQEDGGDSLGANLKSWATQAYGDDSAGNVQKLIEAHPALNTSVGESMLQMLYKGNADFMEMSNLAVSGTQEGAAVSLDEPMQIKIIDSKMNFTVGPEDQPQVPTWGIAQMMPGSMPREVAELYAGKSLSEISPQLQQQAEALQQVFDSSAGRAQLEKAGLTDTQISAAADRLQYLTTKGFPPLPDPGTDAGDYMLAQSQAMGEHYGQVLKSESASAEKITDFQQQQQAAAPLS